MDVINFEIVARFSITLYISAHQNIVGSHTMEFLAFFLADRCNGMRIRVALTFIQLVASHYLNVFSLLACMFFHLR